MHRPLRLTIDRSALQANWRWLQDRAGVPAGAAIKADGYGLGAREAMVALYEAGCRNFFVSTWAEADELGEIPDDSELVVLHGVGPDDVEAALATLARPVLNTAEQVARWKEIAPGRAVRRDDRHRHEPARAAGRRDRRARRAGDRHACTAISPAPTRTMR